MIKGSFIANQIVIEDEEPSGVLFLKVGEGELTQDLILKVSGPQYRALEKANSKHLQSLEMETFKKTQEAKGKKRAAE